MRTAFLYASIASSSRRAIRASSAAFTAFSNSALACMFVFERAGVRLDLDCACIVNAQLKAKRSSSEQVVRRLFMTGRKDLPAPRADCIDPRSRRVAWSRVEDHLCSERQAVSPASRPLTFEQQPFPGRHPVYD